MINLIIFLDFYKKHHEFVVGENRLEKITMLRGENTDTVYLHYPGKIINGYYRATILGTALNANPKTED